MCAGAAVAAALALGRKWRESDFILKINQPGEALLVWRREKVHGPATRILELTARGLGATPSAAELPCGLLALVQLTARGLGATPSAADVPRGRLALAASLATGSEWRGF